MPSSHFMRSWGFMYALKNLRLSVIFSKWMKDFTKGSDELNWDPPDFAKTWVDESSSLHTQFMFSLRVESMNYIIFVFVWKLVGCTYKVKTEFILVNEHAFYSNIIFFLFLIIFYWSNSRTKRLIFFFSPWFHVLLKCEIICRQKSPSYRNCGIVIKDLNL